MLTKGKHGLDKCIGRTLSGKECGCWFEPLYTNQKWCVICLSELASGTELDNCRPEEPQEQKQIESLKAKIEKGSTAKDFLK